MKTNDGLFERPWDVSSEYDGLLTATEAAEQFKEWTAGELRFNAAPTADERVEISASWTFVDRHDPSRSTTRTVQKVVDPEHIEDCGVMAWVLGVEAPYDEKALREWTRLELDPKSGKNLLNRP